MSPAANVDLSQVASMNPDDMVQGGLPTDFHAVISRVRAVPFDYNGKLTAQGKPPIISVAVTYTPDEESGLEPFTQNYSAGGNINDWQPSNDGVNSVPDAEKMEEMEGIYIRRTGNKQQLNKNSNWHQFLTSLRQSGFKEAFPANLDGYEGIKGLFQRVPQEERKGMPTEPGEQQRQVLVCTAYEGRATAASTGASKPATKAGAKAAPAGATAATSASAAGSNGNALDDQISAIIVEAIRAAGGTLPKSEVGKALMKGLPGDVKAKGVKRGSSVDYLQASEVWLYDGDEATLTLVE